jgi:hypothetical protein
LLLNNDGGDVTVTVTAIVGSWVIFLLLVSSLAGLLFGGAES